MTAFLSPRVLALWVLALSGWLLWARQPSGLPPPSPQVPLAVGLWNGKPLDATGDALAAQDAGSIALVEYRLGNELPVWFSEVDGVGTRAAFHPPELCYVGSQLDILERERITVFANGETHHVMRLMVGQDGRQYESWYWFTADGRVTPSYYQQQLWLTVDSVRREPATGTLTRISTSSADGPDASRRRLLAFFTSLTAGPASAAPPASPHGL